MVEKCQSKIPLVVDVYNEMIFRGWNGAELARQSNVTPNTVSRLFKGAKNLKIDSFIKILNTFGFLNKNGADNNLCPVNCDLEMMQICKKVKEIRESKTHWWTLLEQNINSFHKGMESEIGRGSITGTQKPAGRTGLKKKAG